MGDNKDMCACGYGANDHDVGDLLGILMTKMLMLVEVSSDIFPNHSKWKLN